MKAITLTQPWASAIILGHKKIETRSWKTNYRGRIAIHAAKGFPKYAQEFVATERALRRIPARLPLGALIGLATIVDVRRTEELICEISGLERLYGDYSYGRYGFILTDVRPLSEPIPCKGALSLWEVPEEYGRLLGQVWTKSSIHHPAERFIQESLLLRSQS